MMKYYLNGVTLSLLRVEVGWNTSTVALRVVSYSLIILSVEPACSELPRMSLSKVVRGITRTDLTFGFPFRHSRGTGPGRLPVNCALVQRTGLSSEHKYRVCVFVDYKPKPKRNCLLLAWLTLPPSDRRDAFTRLHGDSPRRYNSPHYM
jgi:hypothetical protein